MYIKENVTAGVLAHTLTHTHTHTHTRAVGAGPAGPAAAGPIFGQLTRAKMPYELR